MTDAFWIGLFNLIGIIALAIIQRRQSVQIEAVHKATNSLTDRLVATTRSDALQEGIASEKTRAADAAANPTTHLR